MIRRKNYFIKKKFQISFLSRFVFLLLVESILIALLFMYVSNDTITTGYYNSTLKVQRTSDFFSVSFLLITGIAAIGMAIVGMVVFILLSHRIAGPLYRFEKTLKEIENGNLTTRISLRRTDQVAELKEALNTLIESLDKRMGRVKEGLTELQDLLGHKDGQENASKINKIMSSLKNEIEHFKVTSIHKE